MQKSRARATKLRGVMNFFGTLRGGGREFFWCLEGGVVNFFAGLAANLPPPPTRNFWSLPKSEYHDQYNIAQTYHNQLPFSVTILNMILIRDVHFKSIHPCSIIVYNAILLSALRSLSTLNNDKMSLCVSVCLSVCLCTGYQENHKWNFRLV